MSAEIDRLIEVIAQLREHCPWMGALSHESLLQYLVEESYELIEAVEENHPADELQAELGDVLLQVVLHARLAEEAGKFSFAEVVRGLTEKMVRRNPHVFRPDGSLQDSFPATVPEIVETWHQVKAREKPDRSRFDGIPLGLPALALAQKTLRRGEEEAVSAGAELTEAGLGERLMELLRSAPHLDAEQALRAAVRRYRHEAGG